MRDMLKKYNEDLLDVIETDFKSIAFARELARTTGGAADLLDDAWQNMMLQFWERMEQEVWPFFQTRDEMAKFVCASFRGHVKTMYARRGGNFLGDRRRKYLTESFWTEELIDNQREVFEPSQQSEDMVRSLQACNEGILSKPVKVWAEEFLEIAADQTRDILSTSNCYIRCLVQKVADRMGRNYNERYAYVRVRKIRDMWWKELARNGYVCGARPNLRPDGKKFASGGRKPGSKKKLPKRNVRAQSGVGTGRRRSSEGIQEERELAKSS